MKNVLSLALLAALPAAFAQQSAYGQCKSIKTCCLILLVHDTYIIQVVV